MRDFIDGLKRGHVFRAAAIYAAAAWLLLQVADIVGESFGWPQWWMQLLIALVTGAFPVALLIYWWWHRGETIEPVAIDDSPASRAPLLARKKIYLMVLPFDCLSEETSDRWSADALTEDLTALLAKFSDYTVIARNTAFAFRDNPVDVRELADDPGVSYVLKGSLRRLPGRLRVSVQLLDTETGAQLWSEQYDRSDDEFDQLHDELCRSIALKLGHELTRAEVAVTRRRPPEEWDAWELYQQARGKLQFEGWSRRSFGEAIALLRSSIDRDPELAVAHGYLSLMLALGYWTRLLPDREEASEASESAGRRAMALAPESSEVLGYVGCALSDLGHHERGIPIIERAIELNPSNSQAFAALGAAKVVSGRLEEGAEDLRYALRISPADPGLAPWATVLSVCQSYLGRAEEAEQWASKACRADPRFFGGLLALAMAQASEGRMDKAQASLDGARQLNPDLSAETASALVGNPGWQALVDAGISIPVNSEISRQ